MDEKAVVEFAYGIAKAARIFTLEQVSKHPLLSDRTQPIKVVSKVLRPYGEDFERIPGPYGEPFRFRLTRKAKRKLNVDFKSVSGNSQRVPHWLALGDVWSVMKLNGGISKWIAEPANSANFDAFFVFGGRAFLAEVQRTPIRSNVWRGKWKSRLNWLADPEQLKDAPWQPNGKVVQPRPVLIDLTGQTDETIGLPNGVLRCKSVKDLPHVLQRYILKTQKPPQS